MVYNFTFPASRDHLWSKRYSGEPRQLLLSSDQFNGISISDHVLRRAAKLAQGTQGLDCFLLGTVHTSKDKILINVDRLDPGKEVIEGGQIVKAPTSLVPGDLIVATRVVFEEDELPFTGADYTHTFKALQTKLLAQAPLCDLLCIKCIICVMPDEDLGTPLKVTCELVHPNEELSLTPTPPLPLSVTPVTKALANELVGASKHGFVSLDQSRRGVLLLHSDPAATANPLVGVWASLPLSQSTQDLGPSIWHMLTKFLHNNDVERVPSPPGPFLLCLLSGGSVDTWECERAEQFTYTQLRCSRYVVVPDDQFTDTSTFPLSSVQEGDSFNIFNKALADSKSWLDEPQDDIMPRDAPLATPTQAPKPVPRTPTLQPSRPISPLSILVPSSQAPSTPASPEPRRAENNTKHEKYNNGHSEGYRNGHVSSDHTDQSVFSPPRMLSPTSHQGMMQHPGYPMYPTPDHTSDEYPSQPYFYPPYNPYAIDPRFQYHYPYPYQMYAGHNQRVPVPPVYPPGVSPPTWKKTRSSKEGSAFRLVNGQASPNKRTNHRSPDKYSSVNKSMCSTSTVSSRDSSVPKSRKKHSKRSTPRCQEDPLNTPRSAKSSASSCTSDKKKCTRDPLNRSTGSRANSRTTSSQSERSTASISAKALKMLTLQKRQLDHLQQQVTVLIKSSTPPHKVPPQKVPPHKVPPHKVPPHKVPLLKGPPLKVPPHKVPPHKVPRSSHRSSQPSPLVHSTTPFKKVAVLMKSSHSTAPESTVTDLDRSIENMREQMEALENEIDQSGITKTSEMCVGTGKSLILTQSTSTSICEEKEEKSIQVEEEEEESGHSGSSAGTRSFYVNFKDNITNCEPMSYRTNNSDQYTKFTEAHTYKEYSIYQHPKIAAPSVEHSLYDSKIFDCETSYVEEPRDSPEKENHFSIASKKYLEKHQLASPVKPLKSKSKKRVPREDDTRLLIKNGKIIQTIENIEDSMLHRLQL